MNRGSSRGTLRGGSRDGVVRRIHDSASLGFRSKSVAKGLLE